ncbi:ligand-binding sensor domain-containing diguanylate cyclase [Luteimonas sp. J29]|nr:ligand-binding sensor domain-containing diguanylate cyclase [Luteimonas sp. J29]
MNRGTYVSMPIPGFRAMPAWRRLALLVLAAAGFALAPPARALDPAVPASHYTLTRWNADDGMPHSQVYAIGQGLDGFLWLTTWEGTARFDGLGFSPVPGLREASGGRVASRTLWRDDDGSMLVAVDGAGLMRVPVDGAPGPACRGIDALPAVRLAAATGGGAWIAATDGLYRMRPGGRCERVPGGESLAGRQVNALLAQADGSLWLGLPRGLYRWRDGQVEPLGAGLGLAPGEVRALVRDGDGATWIAGEQGVWRHQGGRTVRLRADRAEGLLVDRAGAVWVAATDAAVLRHWNGRWERLGSEHGVVGYATGALFEDREGLLWFGTTHGLYRIADGPVRGIVRQPGLPSDYVRSVLQTGDGTVWIGHADGLSVLHEGRMRQVYPAPGTPPSSVLALAPAADGGAWVGTYNRGVVHVAAGGAPVRTLVPEDQPFGAEQVRALLEDPDGTLWIGTERGVVAWRDGLLHAEPLPGLPALPVRAFHRGDDGRLWIGLLGGLAWREPDGHLVVQRPGSPYPAQSAFDFHPDPGGGMWIATDRGLLHHGPGGYRAYGEAHGLGGSTVFRVLADDSGHLWLSSNHGVMRVPRSAFAAVDRGERDRLDVALFTRDDGMPSRQANGGSWPAGWRMRDGELWIPTAAGIAVFDPAPQVAPERGAVPLVIDALQVNGEERLPSAPGLVPAGGRVQIRYAGLSLRQPGALRYRYRLHGVDPDWVEAGTAREVTYTNLPGGRLRFEVEVASSLGGWARPAASTAIEFDVATSWWRQPWVVVAAGVAVLGLLVLLHHGLGRRLRERQRRLEAIVAQRTEQLRRTNDELEAASRERELLIEQLAYQASHDPLTGLPNRRAGDRALASALQQADANHGPVCVAIVDVDRFKHINDRYGHQAGDRVLAQVALQLQASLREPGLTVARLGGEEFLVVLGQTTRDAAVAVLERARRAVAAMPLGLDGDTAACCTISIGLVQRQGQEGIDALLQRADAALYEAKRQGRDRIVTG